MNSIRCLTVLGCLVLTSGIVQGDDELDSRLLPAVRKVAEEAKGEGLKKLLVIVRQDASNRPDLDVPGVLRSIRETITRSLNANGTEVITSLEVKKTTEEEKTKRLMSPVDAKKLAEKAEFDGIVSANYKFRGSNVSVRLNLLTTSQRLFVRTVKLRRKPKPSSSSKQPTAGKAPRPINRATSNGTARRMLAVAPPLMNGFSGFRRPRTRETPRAPGSLDREKPGKGERKPNDGEGRKGNDSEGKEREGEKPGKAGDREGDGKDREGKDREGDQEGDKERETEPLPKSQSEVNRRMVDFAVSNIGNKVGNGECWTLAAEALDYSGALPPNLYDFGREIPLNQLQPGDVLQFRNAKFEERNYWAQLGVPNHTAIVYSLKGSKTFILHQNFGKKIVTVLDINFNNITSGSVQAYRGIPRDQRQRNIEEGSRSEESRRKESRD